MSKFSREQNGQSERGRKRLRKKWLQGKASDPFFYIVNRIPPTKSGGFPRVFTKP